MLQHQWINCISVEGDYHFILFLLLYEQSSAHIIRFLIYIFYKMKYDYIKILYKFSVRLIIPGLYQTIENN